MCIIDHINELRAELAGCVFAKDERSEIEAELAALVAERDAKGRAEAEVFPGFLARSPAPS